VIARRLPGRRPLRIVCGLVLGAAIGAPALWGQTDYDDEIRNNQAQLETMRREAEAKRRQARQYANKEVGVLERLQQAEEALAATRRYIRRLEERQTAVKEGIRRTVIDLSWAQGELTSRRGELARRLRHSYMHGKAKTLEVIFSADSFPHLMQRTAFLSRLLEQDRRLVQAVSERAREVHAKLDRLEGQRAELERLQAEKKDEEAHYTSLREERERDLARIRSERAAREQAAEELERAARQMEAVLAELERKRQLAIRQNNRILMELDRLDFGQNRGRLPWPVGGEVITRFGRQQHPRYKTVTISNGIDIAARPGTPVRSVGDGVVDLVQWLPGYGETVIVNHGRGYYTVYGHLSSVSVAPGETVSPGRILGGVGETGSLKGPCLHFEVRQGGSAQDPMIWLR
jgi:septal ring factor EnvC (AmiA/AmiB activator)